MHNISIQKVAKITTLKTSFYKTLQKTEKQKSGTCLRPRFLLHIQHIIFF